MGHPPETCTDEGRRKAGRSTTSKLQEEILAHVRTRGGVHLSSPGELSAARALERRGLLEIEDNGGAELRDGERWWVTPTMVPPTSVAGVADGGSPDVEVRAPDSRVLTYLPASVRITIGDTTIALPPDIDDAVPTMPPPLDLSSLTGRALQLHASALASVVASLGPDDDRTFRATARAELRRTTTAMLERGRRC